MTKQQLNFQDTFLNQVRKESQEIKVVMMNGASIIGVVKGFDNFTVLLQSRNSQHLMYKHAIAQMISRRHETRKPDESLADSDPTERPHPKQSESHKKDDSQSSREKRENFNKIDLSALSTPAGNSSHT